MKVAGRINGRGGRPTRRALGNAAAKVARGREQGLNSRATVDQPSIKDRQKAQRGKQTGQRQLSKNRQTTRIRRLISAVSYTHLTLPTTF